MRFWTARSSILTPRASRFSILSFDPSTPFAAAIRRLLMDERRELFERWRPVVAQALMESKPRLGLTCRHSILLAFSCFAGVQYERVLHE